MKASGIVLAGGRSSRMGRDKALLSVDSETLIERTVKELRKSVDEIIIASNNQCKYNIPDTLEVPDIFTDMGPLGGIHAGLLAANHPYAFVVAADMPFFSADLAADFLKRCQGYDVVVPFIKGKWEPLCAIYSRNCLKPIEQALKNDINKVVRIFPDVKVLKVSEEELARMGSKKQLFCNLNTPEDYVQLFPGQEDLTELAKQRPVHKK